MGFYYYTLIYAIVFIAIGAIISSIVFFCKLKTEEKAVCLWMEHYDNIEVSSKKEKQELHSTIEDYQEQLKFIEEETGQRIIPHKQPKYKITNTDDKQQRVEHCFKEAKALGFTMYHGAEAFGPETKITEDFTGRVK